MLQRPKDQSKSQTCVLLPVTDYVKLTVIITVPGRTCTLTVTPEAGGWAPEGWAGAGSCWAGGAGWAPEAGCCWALEAGSCWAGGGGAPEAGCWALLCRLVPGCWAVGTGSLLTCLDTVAAV